MSCSFHTKLDQIQRALAEEMEKTLSGSTGTGTEALFMTQPDVSVYHAVTPAPSHLLFVVRDANFQSFTMFFSTKKNTLHTF